MFIALFVLVHIWELGVILNFTVADRTDYEIINGNKVIIADYEGSFVVMDCVIEGENLYIDKGRYDIIEMNNTSIEYKNFNKVKCN